MSLKAEAHGGLPESPGEPGQLRLRLLRGLGVTLAAIGFVKMIADDWGRGGQPGLLP